MREVTERFLSKVNKNGAGGCWLWTAAINSKGYGVFRHNGIMRLASTVAFEIFKGPKPRGMHVDHLCRVRHCVNPAHLDLVTPKVNTRRGLAGQFLKRVQESKTHCPRGHPYAGSNLYIAPNGSRQCKMCRKIKQRRKPK